MGCKPTPNQLKIIKSFENPLTRISIATGPAGSGKTHWMCESAKIALRKNKIKKVILTRPMVTVEDEQMGYLPGDIYDKMDPWMLPMMDFLKHEKIEYEYCPLGFIRGRTFKDSFIIADEMQNSTTDQMKVLLTRIGTNSYMGITGDLEQADIQENGLCDFLHLYHKHNDDHYPIGIRHFELTQDDISRDEIVKDILNIYNN